MGNTLLVAHAGSLNSFLQKEFVTSFSGVSGYEITRRAGPAVGLANEILRNELAPDVYMSADAETNRLLMRAEGGDKVRWFIGFARSRMVLAYSPQSRFRADFEAAAAGEKAWWEVLGSPGLVLKRSDPRIDPGGYRSVFVMQLAERFYAQPGLAERVLQGDDNPEQLMTGSPGNLFDGSVDAIFLYVTSARDFGLPYVQLPDAVDLSNPDYAAEYRAATYTNPLGQSFHGTPAIYSVTIPTAATNPEGAAAFVAHLLSEAGRAATLRSGFTSTLATVGGDMGAVPTTLQPLIEGTYEQ